MSNYNIIDLFSGAGGFTLGAFLAGFDPILAVDNDKKITSSFSVNFPSIKLAIENLNNICPEELATQYSLDKENINGIIGGPPCQGFSFIGKRDPKDPRNSLVVKFFEYVKFFEPSFFLMENVKGILSEEFVDYLNKGIGLINNNYIVLDPIIVDSSDYGLPTARSRVFIFGYLPSRLNHFSEEEIYETSQNENENLVKDAISDLPSINKAKKNGNGDFWSSLDDSKKLSSYAIWARQEPPFNLSNAEIRQKHKNRLVSGFAPTNHTERVKKRFSKVEPGKSDKVSKFPRLKWDEHCTTLRAGTGPNRGSYQAVRPIHPEEDRVITVREAARLQSFPDWFQFHNTKWHSFRMIGNSVPPLLAKKLLNFVKGKLKF